MKHYKFSELTYKPTDYSEVQKEINQMKDKVVNATSIEEIKEVLKKYDDLESKISYHNAYTYIRTSLDCTDQYYENACQQEAMGCARLEVSELQNALCESKFSKDIDELYGGEFLRKLRNEAKLGAFGQELLAREQELIGKYQQKKASVRCDFHDKSLSEGEILKYYQAVSREERIEARKSCSKAFLADKDSYFDILRELIHLRIQIAEANGFDSYFAYANLFHGRNDYGETELREFCNQVKKYLVPIIKDIREDQKKELGIPDLKAYDLSLLFLSGNAVPKGDAKVLTQASIKMYDSLSEECGDFFHQMVDTESLNVESSPNKIAGMGFCADLGKELLTFVFGNCNGTDNDVSVFTHEIGHAWQGYLSANSGLPYTLQNPPTDIAEIPSKTMELFSYPYAEGFFGKDADKFRQGHIKKAVLGIAAYCEIFEIETYLYTHPDAPVSDWIAAQMRIEKEYEPDIDFGVIQRDIEEGSALIRNMAIYMFPRYVISYALSEMCAMDLFAAMEKDKKSAWESYTTLCSAGGSLAYPDLLVKCGLRPAYEDGVVKRIAEFIKQKMKTI
ncbi:MAG TPA: M3 family metallopeptidase [Lachnospiraceae bacterium]|nr:M3 family metallopeptidase [Lachnospiraceae bacterium]